MQKILRKTKSNKDVYTFQMTEQEYHSADNDMQGLCVGCGEVHDDNCEPDARNYECSNCGQRKVFGIQELLVMGYIGIGERTMVAR
jgi:predicted RNA-binding Zn-ribbon protein involved in translation (DUF1610 family)